MSALNFWLLAVGVASALIAGLIYLICRGLKRKGKKDYRRDIYPLW